MTDVPRICQAIRLNFRRVRDSLDHARLRRQISVFLMSVGATLLALTSITYYWVYSEQQRLLQQLEAQAANEAPAEQASDTVLLSIPKIELNAAIVEGTSRAALLLAPGHLKKTAFPGQKGNAVVAAHRDTFFRRLHEMEQGDEIVVTRHGRRFHYVVVGKSIVKPEETSVTFPTDDTRLTLVTCYPTYYVGPAPKRLVVVAKLRSDSEGSTPLRASVASKVSSLKP